MKRKFLLKISVIILVQALISVCPAALYAHPAYSRNQSTLSPLLEINSVSVRNAFSEGKIPSLPSLSEKISFPFPPRFKTDERTREVLVRQTVGQLLKRLQQLPRESRPEFTQKVDKKFWGTTIDISKYIPYIGLIKIFGYLSHKSKTRVYNIPALKLYVRVENGQAGITELTQRLFSLLNGSEIELNYSRVITNRTHEDEFWDGWKTDYTNSKYCYRICTEHLYTGVVKIIRRIIAQDENKPQTIVDIFGGDGRFLKELFTEIGINHPATDAQYHLIDRNRKSLQEAQTVIGNNGKISIWDKDLGSQSAIEEIIKDRPSIVTAIGGLVKRVVTFDQAYRIAKDVYKALPDGGYFILTGYKEPHLNAKIFSAIGFEVLNKSFTVKDEFGDIVPYSLYILRKPLVTKHANPKTPLPSNLHIIPRVNIPNLNQLLQSAI